MNKSGLAKAIKKAGTEAALAALVGVKNRQVVHNWHTRGVPAEICPLIEEATGVRCEEMRPDIAWRVLRCPLKSH